MLRRLRGWLRGLPGRRPVGPRGPTGPVGKRRLSAEFMVKRMTRPFGTFGFSVNAESAL